MQQYSIRDLSRNTYKIISELPVVITKNGKPYIIIKLIDDVTTLTNVTTPEDVTTPHVTTSKVPNVTTYVTTPKKIIKTIEDLPKQFLARDADFKGYCAYPFCHEVAVAIVDDKPYCMVHK